MSIIVTNLEANETFVVPIETIYSFSNSMEEDFCTINCNAQQSWMNGLAYSDWLLDYATCSALPNGLQQPCYVIADYTYDQKILNADLGHANCLNDCLQEG